VDVRSGSEIWNVFARRRCRRRPSERWFAGALVVRLPSSLLSLPLVRSFLFNAAMPPPPAPDAAADAHCNRRHGSRTASPRRNSGDRLSDRQREACNGQSREAAARQAHGADPKRSTPRPRRLPRYRVALLRPDLPLDAAARRPDHTVSMKSRPFPLCRQQSALRRSRSLTSPGRPARPATRYSEKSNWGGGGGVAGTRPITTAACWCMLPEHFRRQKNPA